MQLNQLRYNKKMGSFKPCFEGKPDDYYQQTCSDICIALTFCFTIVIIFFFINIGLFFWSRNVSTANLILVYSIILCVFIPLFIMFAFVGSRNKIDIQLRLIQQALHIITQQKDKRQHRYQRNSHEISRIPIANSDIKLQIE